MKRIFKYETMPGPILHLPMGPDDKIIHVAEQAPLHDAPIKVWAEVTVQPWQPSGAIRPGDDINCDVAGFQPQRLFTVLATGAEVPENFAHRGTAVCANGALVWHLYEIL